MTVDVEVGGRVVTVAVSGGGGRFAVDAGGSRHDVDVARVGEVWSLLVGRRSYEVVFHAGPAGELTVHVNGRAVALRVAPPAGPRPRRPEQDGPAGGAERRGPARLVAPMPGRVVKVHVTTGESVEARQPLVVIEAMKMENELRAPRAGRVAEVRVAEGALVEARAVLVVIE